MGGKVIDNDKGFRDLSKRIKALGGSITVGVHAEDADKGEYDGEASVVDVAFFNEFGTEHIPERSFLRSTMDENREKYSRSMTNVVKGILKGAITVKQGLGMVAMEMEGDVKKKIRDLKVPPNKESTIARKKSSNPLIDDGVMRRRVKGKVNAKGAADVNLFDEGF